MARLFAAHPHPIWGLSLVNIVEGHFAGKITSHQHVAFQIPALFCHEETLIPLPLRDPV